MRNNKAGEEARAALKAAIINYKLLHGGNSPYMAQLADLCYMSTSTVRYHLAYLEVAGEVIADPDGHGYLVPGEVYSPPNLPLALDADDPDVREVNIAAWKGKCLHCGEPAPEQSEASRTPNKEQPDITTARAALICSKCKKTSVVTWLEFGDIPW